MSDLWLLFLLALMGKVTDAEKQYDVRCNEALWTPSRTSFKIALLLIDEAPYKRNGIIKCKQGGNLQELEPSDDWATIIDRVKMLMDDHGLTCRNLPTITSHMSVYLSTEDSYLEYRDCEWSIDFCEPCGGCHDVDHMTGTNYSSTVAWALKEREDGICEDRWNRDNFFSAMTLNESWFHEIRFPCDHCFNDFCGDNALAKSLNDKLLTALGGDLEARRKICYQGSIYGTMNGLCLQDRFGNFSYWDEQMRVFGHHQWKSDLFHACWTSALLVFLYLWTKNYCNPWRRAQRIADQPDPVMEFLIARLAAGHTRKARNERRRKRGLKKNKKNKKAKSKQTKNATKKSAKNKKSKHTKGKKVIEIDPASKLMLPNGRMAIKKRGPGGRGGYGGRGRGARGGRGGRGGK